MKNRQIFSCILIFQVFCGINLFAEQNTQKAITKRYCIVIGANNGGKERVQLRYAVSDAESILKVFEELGGVSREDSLLLAEPDLKSFYTEIGRLQTKVEKARSEYSRIEVIFYYSGHSNEEHILLSGEKISYKDFRETINNVDADVRIAILDSCASGAFTRLKGGKKRLPFLMDTAYNMKGYAVMTSSSSNEASQESDLIKGSFFTHYLISGMRGAADMTQDGRVTLNEVYQFAFNETLAETAKTMSGPQHPHYNIQMSGTGDVVMTDIRRSSAVLILNKDISGKIFIHDRKNLLVVELAKPFGRKIELGLEEGEYRVINIMEGQVFESKIALQGGKDFELNPDEFTKTDKKYTTPRGDRSTRVQKETFLRDKSRKHFYAELGSKSTSVYGEYAALVGGGIGVTFNGVFSVGFAAYARAIAGMGALELDVDFDPGKPAYAGVTFEYLFAPWRKIHFKAIALFGSGNSWGRTFYIFEPEMRIMLNLSRIIRVGIGVSMPITDKDNNGLKNPIFGVTFRYGK